MRSDDTALTPPRSQPSEDAADSASSGRSAGDGRPVAAGFGSQVGPGVVIVVVALLALGAGLGVTSHLWGDLAGRMIDGNIPDGIHYAWWLGHTPHALRHGSNPFQSLDLNWPEGVSAMDNTTLLLPALVLTPISWLAGSLVSLNVLNVVAVPACALAGYWALRQVPLPSRSIDSAEVTGSTESAGRIGRPAALVGAVTFAISPGVVNSLVGHITMAFAPGLPILIALSMLAWAGDRPVRTGLLLGLATTGQVFTGEEVLFQAVLASLLIMLVSALSRPRLIRAAASRLIRALIAAFVVFLPLAAYPLYVQFLGPYKEKGSPFLLDYYGADVTAFTTPTARVLLHNSSQALAATHFAGGTEEHLAYLGWPLLITCLITAVVCWRWVAVRCAAVVLVVAMALSLGGRLWIKGVWTEHPGPYRLFQSLPVTDSSLATRFGLLAAAFAGALLAFAVHRLSTSSLGWSNPVGGTLVAAGLSVVCLVPLIPLPLDVVAAPAVPTYFRATARDLPKDSVVVVLPYPTAVNPVAMRWQSVAGYDFRMPGGYFLGPAGDGHAYVGGSADPPTAQLFESVASTGQAQLVTPEVRAEAVRQFAAWGTDRIVVGPDPAAPALRQLVNNLLQRDPEMVGGVAVWTVGPAGT